MTETRAITNDELIIMREAIPQDRVNFIIQEMNGLPVGSDDRAMIADKVSTTWNLETRDAMAEVVVMALTTPPDRAKMDAINAAFDAANA